MKEVILLNGYVKKGYGFIKITEKITHWVTLFEGGSLQMYSYYSDDDEFDKVYDTGMLISITPEELNLFIKVLINNHN